MATTDFVHVQIDLVRGETRQRLKGDPTREGLIAAVEACQAGARARLVDPAELVDMVSSDWDAVSAMAATLGLRPVDLHARGEWWLGTGNDYLDRGAIQTTIVHDSGTWIVDRRTPHYSLDQRKVRLSYDRHAATSRATVPPASSTPGVLLEDLVRRLHEQLDYRRGRLADLLEDLEGAPDPRLDPERARDLLDRATLVLDDLVSGMTCRLCGCQQHSPCETTEGPCGWAWQDQEGLVCTACAQLAEVLDPNRDDAGADGPGEEE